VVERSDIPHLSTTVTTGVSGIATGAAVTIVEALLQPPTVSITVYVPGSVTSIEGVVSPVDHNTDPPDTTLNVELPQLFTTLATGAGNELIGFADTEAGTLVHPPTVCVTV
jgi:hypothetical protein